jgi:hypothetical protein
VPAHARVELARAEIGRACGRPSSEVDRAVRAAIALAEPIGMHGTVRSARRLIGS